MNTTTKIVSRSLEVDSKAQLLLTVTLDDGSMWRRLLSDPNSWQKITPTDIEILAELGIIKDTVENKWQSLLAQNTVVETKNVGTIDLSDAISSKGE